MEKLTFTSLEKKIREKINSFTYVFQYEEISEPYTDNRGFRSDGPKYKEQYVNEVIHSNVLHTRLKNKFGITEELLQETFKKYASALAVCDEVEHKEEFDQYLYDEVNQLIEIEIERDKRYDKLSKRNKIDRISEFPVAFTIERDKSDTAMKMVSETIHFELDQLIANKINKTTYTKSLKTQLKVYAKHKEWYDITDKLYQKHTKSREYILPTLINFRELDSDEEKNVEPWTYTKSIFYLREYCKWYNSVKFNKTNLLDENKKERDKNRYHIIHATKRKSKEARTNQIMELYNTGKTITDISMVLDIPRTTVSYIVKRKKE
jgi:hypothetical protein